MDDDSTSRLLRIAYSLKEVDMEMVHETVNRGCKEQRRQIEMNLMLGEIRQLLDLIWSWISPTENDQNVFRVLSKSREIKVGKYENSSDVAEQHRFQSLQKANGYSVTMLYSTIHN